MSDDMYVADSDEDIEVCIEDGRTFPYDFDIALRQLDGMVEYEVVREYMGIEGPYTGSKTDILLKAIAYIRICRTYAANQHERTRKYEKKIEELTEAARRARVERAAARETLRELKENDDF